jgi:hypothetical protein
MQLTSSFNLNLPLIKVRFKKFNLLSPHKIPQIAAPIKLLFIKYCVVYFLPTAENIGSFYVACLIGAIHW